MKQGTLRIYGKAPYRVAVIHGGPGAPGEMAPVAKELSSLCGILEPLQSKDSIDKQIKELKSVMEIALKKPIILIGWSWGAWLSYLFASKYPNLIKKLILVSSGPFEEKYAKTILKNRLSHLNTKDKARLQNMMDSLNDKRKVTNKTFLEEFEILLSKADSFNPLQENPLAINFQKEIYSKVWTQAEKLRSSGKLLAYGKNISCPVVAIHGDYDPHPYQGVNIPLSKTIKNFRFVLLSNCGHKPWIEKSAKDRFYSILKNEIS